MRISTHAKKRYIKRIAFLPFLEDDEELLQEAEEEIEKAVKDPDEVRQREEGMIQLHIRGDIAVPVGESDPDNDDLSPYEEIGDKTVVPTLYRSDQLDDTGKTPRRTAEA